MSSVFCLPEFSPSSVPIFSCTYKSPHAQLLLLGILTKTPRLVVLESERPATGKRHPPQFRAFPSVVSARLRASVRAGWPISVRLTFLVQRCAPLHIQS